RYTLHRNGFAGPLTVLLADRQVRHQQGVTGPTISVAADANEFVYPINIPTWLEMNRTGRMVVMAVGEVADEQGVKHKVSFSSGTAKDQIIILTAPCPLNIRTTRGSLRAASGQPVEVGVKVNRGVLAAAPIQVVVLPPEHIKGVVAEPLTIPADQSEGVLKLRFQEPLGPFNMPVTIRATMISEGDPVLAETSLDLVAAD
ncbi:MAG: hypothetical protein QF805_16020, partial [Pirellulaceae bacterium]|nr:hypothetical protein [Pirellulaceae bacterium]